MPIQKLLIKFWICPNQLSLLGYFCFMDQLTLQVEDISINIEFAEFLRAKLKGIADNLAITNQEQDALNKRKAELTKMHDKYKGMYERIQSSLMNGSGLNEMIKKTILSKDHFDENWNANDLLRHIVISSERPLTTSEIYEKFTKYPNLKKRVVMNTSKVSTRLARIVDNEQGEIVRGIVNNKQCFGRTEVFEE
jgi:hypothetical protein